MAHDEAPDLVVWPTPEEKLAERNRGKQRRSSSRECGDRTRGGGGSGGSGKNGGGGDHHHRRGGDSASSAGVPEGAAEGATLFQQPGQLAAALAEATEGGGMAPEDVQRGTARQLPPARLRPLARTTARRSW